MKKLIAGLLLILPAFALAQGCNWDFERAKKEGLPPMYCFGRVEDTMNGFLKRACSGTECKSKSNIFGL